MANTEHFDVFAGEDRTLTLHARDSTNTAASLTGKTIAWRVGAPPNDPNLRFSVFSKTGNTLSASAGTFTVTIAATDTIDFGGEYLHQAITTDGSGNQAVVSQGRLKVRRLIDA